MLRQWLASLTIAAQRVGRQFQVGLLRRRLGNGGLQRRLLDAGHRRQLDTGRSSDRPRSAWLGGLAAVRLFAPFAEDGHLVRRGGGSEIVFAAHDRRLRRSFDGGGGCRGGGRPFRRGLGPGAAADKSAYAIDLFVGQTSKGGSLARHTGVGANVDQHFAVEFEFFRQRINANSQLALLNSHSADDLGLSLFSNPLIVRPIHACNPLSNRPAAKGFHATDP